MQVKNLSKEYNGNIILNNISFTLNSHDKIGLCGENGSGKTTFLSAIYDYSLENNPIIELNGDSVAYLKQEISHNFDNYTIINYIKHEIKIDILEEKIHNFEKNLTDDNIDEYNEALNLYLAIDGYNFEYNLKEILTGLSLSADVNKKVKNLSGGEKIKVLLAIMLLQNGDILLLDEPTNNLDMKAIIWLENYLKSLDKKMIIVSHDETFLNNIVNKIFELDKGNLKVYNLKYNDFLDAKEIEYIQSENKYYKALDEKAKLKKQVLKAKEWANKGNKKQAHNDNDKIANNYAKERTNNGNISKFTTELNDIVIPKFKEKIPINFFFRYVEEKGNKDIVLDNLICGYDNFTTKEINEIIPFGTRMIISGSNGSGKTTLLKTIIGKLKPISGKVKIGNEVKIGYISQDTLEVNNNQTIYEYLTNDKTNVELSYLFTLFAKFSFNYEDKDKQYNKLSPGERTRINLIKLALDKINILILDEVTNHLDTEAINLIYELIENFRGTIISVSHNRKYNEVLKPNINLDIETGKNILNENIHKII